MLPRLNLQLLGTLQITINQKPVGTFRSRKAPILLAYLAYTRTTHQREVLADMLWDASSTKQSLSNLRTILAQLRDVFDDHLIITNQTLAFDTSIPYTLDVETLHDTLSQTLRGKLDDKQAHDLDIALKLYRGDLMQDVIANNATRFNEWLQRERENLRQQVVQGYQKLTAHYKEAQSYDLGLLATGRWLDLDHLNELAHRQHMHLLALNQQRTLALRQFDMCRDMLTDEFGVEPSPDTIALYNAIRDGKLDTSPPATQQHVTSDRTPTIKQTLPPELNRFVGQTDLVDVLTNYLASSDKSLITLTGVGGSGKSRLAIHVASIQAQFRDGIVFIDLNDVIQPDDVPLKTAQTLDMVDYDDPILPIARYVGDRHMLLIFDNFETVLGARHFIQQLLTHSGHSKILITSRIPLNLYGEHVIIVQPLNLPAMDKPTTDADELLENESIQLFVERVRERRHDISFTEDDLQDIAKICHLLDGLPLAIELVAARSHRNKPADILAQLTENSPVDLLANPMTNRPDRHRSLRNTFNWSYALLDDTQQIIFMQLGIFAGSFSLGSATHILDQINDGHYTQNMIIGSIHQLTDHNLLQHDPQQNRLRMLDTIRTYARELLQASALYDKAVDYHARYYQERATQIVTHSRTFSQAKADWTIELEHDYANYAQAFESSAILNQYLQDIAHLYEEQSVTGSSEIRMSASIEIARAPEVVFDYMVAPDKIPQWGTVWKHIEFVTPGDPRLGSVFDYELLIFGKRLTGRAKIIEFEPNRKKVTQLVSQPEMGRTTFLCEPTATGTRATIRHEAEDLSRLIKVIRPIVSLLINRSLRSWLENLKTLLEAPAEK